MKTFQSPWPKVPFQTQGQPPLIVRYLKKLKRHHLVTLTDHTHPKQTPCNQMYLLQALTWTTTICARHQALWRPSLLILRSIAEAEVTVGRSWYFLFPLVTTHLRCGGNARGQSWSCVWLADSTWTPARRATWGSQAMWWVRVRGLGWLFYEMMDT